MHVHATLTHMHAHAILTNMHLHATLTTHAFRKHLYYFEDILLLASEIPKQLRPQEMIHLLIQTNTSLAYVTSCIHGRHELFHQHHFSDACPYAYSMKDGHDTVKYSKNTGDICPPLGH